jgi:hypothetical protein
MSKICNCPNPPGGTVECDDDQLALCAYIDGQIVGRCYSRPIIVHILSFFSEADKQLALQNWAIRVITGADRRLREPIDAHLLVMLYSGRYTEDGKVVTFSLPKDLKLVTHGGAALA